MQRLRFMQGEWQVEARLMGKNNVWVTTPVPTETTIKPLLSGACHHEIMPIALDGKPDGQIVRLFFSWSYDPLRKIYRMVSCDDASGLMGIMEGDFIPGTDTIVISDLHTNTAVLDDDGQPAYFRQLASSKTSADSFTDIVSESYDNGASWQPVFRALHTRKTVTSH